MRWTRPILIAIAVTAAGFAVLNRFVSEPPRNAGSENVGYAVEIPPEVNPPLEEVTLNLSSPSVPNPMSKVSSKMAPIEGIKPLPEIQAEAIRASSFQDFNKTPPRFENEGIIKCSWATPK